MHSGRAWGSGKEISVQAWRTKGDGISRQTVIDVPEETPEMVPDLARGGRPPRVAGDSDALGVPVVLSLAALVSRAWGSCRHHDADMA